MLEPKYTEIKHVCGNDLYIVKNGDKLQLTNKAGDKKVELGYNDVTSINNENIVFVNDGKYGIASINNEEKVKAEYQEIKYAFGDYYIAKKNDKFGVINSLSGALVPFEYDNLEFNKDADCIIGKKANDNNLYFIDRSIELKASGTSMEVRNGYIRIKSGDGYKIYNLKFEEKSNRDAYPDNTLFVAKNDNKFGLVNKDGTLVVPYEYEDALEQNDYGYTAVKKDGKWGVIDQKGNVVVQPTFSISEITDVMFIGKWHSQEKVNTLFFIDN